MGGEVGARNNLKFSKTSFHLIFEAKMVAKPQPIIYLERGEVTPKGDYIPQL